MVILFGKFFTTIIRTVERILYELFVFIYDVIDFIVLKHRLILE